jgi:hypothetical protein
MVLPDIGKHDGRDHSGVKIKKLLENRNLLGANGGGKRNSRKAQYGGTRGGEPAAVFLNLPSRLR